jgi:hypothetical protein
MGLMMIHGMMMNEARKTRSLLTIPVNITSVKVPMMLTKIIGMMIDRGDILGRTHMEDYGTRLDDYVNGHEQDDDDGDLEGDFCYGIHECIRRRMRGNKPTDMEVDGYPLGDYLTTS